MTRSTVGELRQHRLVLGWPLPAVILATALLTVGATSSAYVLAFPFDAAAFGGLTLPTVLAAGFADGFNPCAFVKPSTADSRCS